MFLVSFGALKCRHKILNNKLENSMLGVSWNSYHFIDSDSSSIAYKEFLYMVQKSQPQTNFFITIGDIQYTYYITMLEDCIENKVIAIAAQPFEENGRLGQTQINWYI